MRPVRCHGCLFHALGKIAVGHLGEALGEAGAMTTETAKLGGLVCSLTISVFDFLDERFVFEHCRHERRRCPAISFSGLLQHAVADHENFGDAGIDGLNEVA